MTKYAETQMLINGAYTPTTLTLAECWNMDSDEMVDYNLLRDNARPMEAAAIEYLMEAERSIDPDDVPDVYLNIAHSLHHQLSESITARVLAAGKYVRDGKWTREVAIKTAAQQVSALLHDDGTIWETEDGASLDEVATGLGASYEHRTENRGGTGNEIYSFGDGSRIIACEGAWDLGFTGCNCTCWDYGADHVADCPEA